MPMIMSELSHIFSRYSRVVSKDPFQCVLHILGHILLSPGASMNITISDIISQLSCPMPFLVWMLQFLVQTSVSLWPSRGRLRREDSIWKFSQMLVKEGGMFLKRSSCPRSLCHIPLSPPGILFLPPIHFSSSSFLNFSSPGQILLSEFLRLADSNTILISSAGIGRTCSQKVV